MKRFMMTSIVLCFLGGVVDVGAQFFQGDTFRAEVPKQTNTCGLGTLSDGRSPLDIILRFDNDTHLTWWFDTEELEGFMSEVFFMNMLAHFHGRNRIDFVAHRSDIIKPEFGVVDGAFWSMYGKFTLVEVRDGQFFPALLKGKIIGRVDECLFFMRFKSVRRLE